MTALAADKARTRWGDARSVGSVPAAASTITYAGSLVAVVTGGSDGYGRPAATATTHAVLGVATKKVDNSAGAAGAETIPYETGVFSFENSSAGDLIDQGDVGALCYVVDDDTVALTNGSSSRSVAGIIMGMDGTKVKVLVGAGLQS